MDGDDWVPSGFQSPFPIAQDESVVRVDRSIVSAAMEAPPAAPEVPAQPAEVRARARVRFVLLSDASPAALEQAE